MPNVGLAARRAAKRHGVRPELLEALVVQESGGNPKAVSPKGARGVAQFMPATAKSMGVNLNDGRISDDLDGAARLIASYIKKYGSEEKALRAYNAGPGAIEKSRNYAETNNYVKNILGKAGKAKGTVRPKGTPGKPGTDPKYTPSSLSVDTTAVDDARKQFALSMLDGDDPIGAAGQFAQAKADIKVTPAAYTPGKPGTPGSSAQAASRPAGGSSGAAAAVGFAAKRVGQYRESTGPNRGPQLDQLQKRLGFTGAPWCAIFTSVAATKGGMPASGRTAAVATVRQQAQSGSGGYHKGFFNNDPRPGDLILYGNRHIGMVEKVVGGKIHTIEGNTSGGKVQRRVKNKGAGDIVRPKYR